MSNGICRCLQSALVSFADPTLLSTPKLGPLQVSALDIRPNNNSQNNNNNNNNNKSNNDKNKNNHVSRDPSSIVGRVLLSDKHVTIWANVTQSAAHELER
jgi:hypothetical protein